MPSGFCKNLEGFLMEITYNLCGGCKKQEKCEIRKKYGRYMRTHPIICDPYKRTGSLCKMCYWWSMDMCIQGIAALELLGISKKKSKCDLFRLKNGVEPDDKEDQNGIS